MIFLIINVKIFYYFHRHVLTPTDSVFNIFENKNKNGIFYHREIDGTLIHRDTIETMSMRFHKEWNWLMPVVNKILSDSYPIEVANKIENVKKSLHTCSIEETFNSVSDFIECYNSIKNP